MVVPDNKLIMSFVKRLQDYFTIIEEANTLIQDLRDEWQATDPDITVEGSILDPVEKTAANMIISNIQTFINDNQSTINALKNKNVGSHQGNALD